MMSFKAPISLTFVLLSFAVQLLAQTAPLGSAIGTSRNGTFVGSFDQLNLGNLNAYITIPLFTKTGRGINYAYDLTYNSSLWMNDEGGWSPRGGRQFGWQVGPAQQIGGASSAYFVSDTCQVGKLTKNVYTVTDFQYTTPDGVILSFDGSTTYNQCTDSTTSFTATSPYGYSLHVGGFHSSGLVIGDLTDPSGNLQEIQFTPVSSFARAALTDSNGNTSYTPETTNSVTSYQDTAGLTPLAVTADMKNSSYGNSLDSGLPSTLQYIDPNGATQTITIQYQTFTVQTNFGAPGVSEYPALTSNLPTAILMPDGSSYTFTYEVTPGYPGSVTGRLASVKLPTGGTIQYHYVGGYNGIESDGSIAGVVRSTTDGSVTYTRSSVVPATPTSNGSSSTTVTDPLGNQTVLGFRELSNAWTFFEVSRAVYTGSAGGALLRSVSTCYNSAAASCNSQALSVPLTEIYKTTTLETGLSSAVDTHFDAIGNVTQQSEYDFGASSPTKVTSITYAALENNIQDRPQSITETDGSSNQISYTTFSYDDSSCTLTSTSGLPNHRTVSGSRGNLTTVTQWVNTTNTSLITHSCYDDAGQLRSTTDPSGNVTQFTYDSAADTFLTGETYPTPTSGVSLSSAATYDSNTGLILHSTDTNSQTTTFAYDSMLRPTLITYPAITSGTPTRSFTYPSTTQTNVSSPLGNGSTATSQVVVDGYGRGSRSAVYNGQPSSSYYQEDTCYDASGHVSFRSLPYQGAGFGQAATCSGAGDSFSYDALNRPVKITRNDGSYLSYVYGGRATEVIDEGNGNGSLRPSRAFQTDAFGRLISVCEITSTALIGSGSPQACGLDIGGLTGYLTSYTYNLAQHTSIITQGIQSRVFQNDSLNRLVMVQEPELGTSSQSGGNVTYSYSYNTTGLVATRSTPLANQNTNSSATTTRTLQYDQIGRPLTLNYDDGITASTTYTYDLSSIAGQTLGNPKGRLVEAATNATESIYSYDALGNVTSKATCLPGRCPTSFLNQASGYDLIGDLASRSDGNGTTYTYTYSPAAEMLSVTSSLVNSTHPSAIIAGAQYGPFGITSRNLISGAAEAYSYDPRGRLTGSSVSRGGTVLASDFASYAADGSVISSSSSAQGNWVYSYDEFNRLICADHSTCSGSPTPAYQFAYDRWGNRLSETPGASPGTNPSKNQFTSFAYDIAGNMMNDGIHNYLYDAESRIVNVDGGNTASYGFDAEGNRVQIAAGGATTQYLFDSDGAPISAWSSTGAFVRGNIWSDGEQTAYYTGSDTYALHGDWVGTVRLQLESQGQVSPFGSLPFGDGQSGYSADDDTLHFGLLNNDPSSGLSHSRSRDYSPTLGKWTSPDVYMGSYDASNPQTFNRYAYSLNRPLGLVDPSGFEEYVPTGGDPASSDSGGASFTATCKLFSCALRHLLNVAGQFLSQGYANYNPGDAPSYFPTGFAGFPQISGYQNPAQLPRPQLQAQQQNNNTELAQNNTPAPPNGRTNSPAQGQQPNSTTTIPQPDGSTTERTYGPDGKAVKDVDTHPDHGAGSPHAHDWDWGKTPPRQPGRPLTPEEQANIKKTAAGVVVGVGTGYIIYRVIRFLPSLAPPLWPTIPANAIIP